MALLVELSGELPDLAREEALTTVSMLAQREADVLAEDGPVLMLRCDDVDGARVAGRLGLAHHVSEGAVSGEVSAAPEMAASVDIGDAGSFRVRVHRTEGSSATGLHRSAETRVGALIQERTGARVDLTRPDAEVRLVLARRAYAGLLAGSVDRKGMEARAVKHRPFSHPISLHPKYARAMVNLAKVHEGGRIMDPFCGTGGVLIEAAMLGHQPLGSDIDPRMVEGSRENLGALGLSADLEVADVAKVASDLAWTPDAIVTDPPYGRSTSLHGGDEAGVLASLYGMASSVLGPGGRLVVCLPDPARIPPEGSGLEVLSVHPMKVHRSLTRHVCVLIRRFS
jgi:tRNA (guanine10-N2)-dimethyltransferase